MPMRQRWRVASDCKSDNREILGGSSPSSGTKNQRVELLVTRFSATYKPNDFIIVGVDELKVYCMAGICRQILMVNRLDRSRLNLHLA